MNFNELKQKAVDQAQQQAKKLGNTPQMKDLTKKLPGHQSRFKQKYRPDDNTFRDMYDEPDQKRAERTVVKSFTYVWWMTAAVFFGVQIFYWILAGVIMSILHNFTIAQTGQPHYSILGSIEYLVLFSPHKGLLWFGAILMAIILSACAYYWLWRNWKVQNLLYDNSDLNQYHDNARIAQPEELVRQFELVPDSGAHSKGGDMSSIIGHIMIDNQGVNQVTLPKRYEKDVKDEHGKVIHAAKSLVRDENGKPIYEKVPMFDKKFANTLFDSAFLPKLNTPIGKKVRHWYNPKTLDYNSKRAFGQLPYDSVADLVNNDWYIPPYEVQRPGGAYIVDSQPNNTMVLAMTRSGKGF